MGGGKLLLQGFHQRLIGTGKEFEDAVIGRFIGNGIDGVDDDFAGKVVDACAAQSFRRDQAFDRENDNLSEGSCFGEATDTALGIFALPARELGCVAGAEHGFMSVGEEAISNAWATSPEPMIPTFMRVSPIS